MKPAACARRAAGSPWLQAEREYRQQSRDDRAIGAAIARGDVVAWVQGRWEIGPRALGNRSLLAEPYSIATKDKLNRIKQRENYRPIAPCCREEDLASLRGVLRWHQVGQGAGGGDHLPRGAVDRGAAGVELDRDDFPDPHMLYFRRVRSPRLGAITHVDGSARVQSVTAAANPELHSLLNAFAAETGLGVLCNTSLNHNRRGFINRMSDLIRHCEDRQVEHMVVGDRWYQRID